MSLLLDESEIRTEEFSKYGTVESIELPRVVLRVAREDVAKTLNAILDNHTIHDVTVEDPPLEEVIAEMFSKVDPSIQRATDEDIAASAGHAGTESDA